MEILQKTMTKHKTKVWLILLVMHIVLGGGLPSVALAQIVCGVGAPANYQVGEVVNPDDTTSADPGANGIPGEGINQKGKSKSKQGSFFGEDLSVRSREFVLFLAVHVLGKHTPDNVENDDKFKKMIRNVNRYYARCNVGFVVRYFNYIDNSSKKVFKQGEWQSENLFRRYNKPRLINVYYVDTLYSAQGKMLDGIGSFPEMRQQNIDRVVLAKDQAVVSSTLAHEIGHYLGLLHTHETSHGAELVNGTNSHKAGDFLSDTPADPNLRGLVDARTCTYKGKKTDANKEPYRPDVRNIMSYSEKNCRKKFSQGQCNLIRERLVTSRSHLEMQPKEFASLASKDQAYRPLKWDHTFRRKLSDLVQTAIHKNQNKILILAGHSMVNWSRRLKHELTHTPAIANLIGKDYAYGYLEINENVNSFFKLTYDNAWIGNQQFYQQLKQIFHPSTARTPTIVIIKFDQRLGKVTKSARIHYRVIGYRKPNEMLRILGGGVGRGAK